MSKNIFSLTSLIISIYLLIHTFYKSEVYWIGTMRDYYFIYYLISVVLIIFSIITFYLNDRIKVYIIISLISVIFTLYIFEGYFTWKLAKNIKNYKEQIIKQIDTRNKLEVYEDLKKIDKDVVVRAPGYLYINEKNISFSGVSNSKTINCNENGYYSTFQSDRYGFNNPDDEWDQQQIEYLLVGDSFTLGNCVNRPDDIASILRILSNKSVLNLGSASSGPLIEYATLREYLKPNVKNILWVYFEGNDIYELQNELKLSILVNYLKDLNFIQNLKLKQKQINEAVNKSIYEAKQIMSHRKQDRFTINFAKFIKLYNLRELITQQIENQLLTKIKIQPEFKEILKKANDLSNKNNSKLYFIYLPEYSRYKTTYDNSNYQAVIKIVSELNIPFIDIHQDVFKKERNPLVLFPLGKNGHYNVEGYRKVAELIYQFISND